MYFDNDNDDDYVKNDKDDYGNDDYNDDDNYTNLSIPLCCGVILTGCLNLITDSIV